ncbi:hypothetical protein QVD17_25221 [Tagetes erecta]|uniref:Mucin-like protein n=1 Tax=Tagetes erecta TaxID=13708 RepID=A0AAD8KME5_TARER|nr:hypothetical protein QVD17_25221 [Tagetes erecta]
MFGPPLLLQMSADVLFNLLIFFTQSPVFNPILHILTSKLLGMLMMMRRSLFSSSCCQSIKISIITTCIRRLSTEKWNDAWETAWLPEDLSAKNRAPWETDVNFSTPDLDTDTKAFVEEMTDNWEQRRNRSKEEGRLNDLKQQQGNSLVDKKSDYRVKKQRVHAGLWAKEIEKMEEAKLAGSNDHHLDTFLHTASEIFECGSESKVRDMKNKPDGWETTTKAEDDGNIWEMSQREEDVLVQEYERRIAFTKFKIASFIKQHIFSRRRPIDGWKYMIEELGPNARRGSKASVSRLPSLADPATQPFKEDSIPISTTNTNTRAR